MSDTGELQAGPLVVKTIPEVRRIVSEAKRQGKVVGFVPTMGALHEGHLSLIRRCRDETGFVAVSIFVNPTQFGPQEDLERYPRPFERDVELCAQHRVDLIFAPDVETMYAPDFCTYVTVERLSEQFEGACRPGHFRGVATVVLKLFNIVMPDVSYFGQKDAQQARIIQQMVRDLDLPVEIRVCPTVREPDGLALSSRNQYLSDEERTRALSLSRALFAARDLVAAGERDPELIRAKMHELLTAEKGVVVDYAELVDPDTFEPVQTLSGHVLAIVAARVGPARLIDNLPIAVPEPRG